MQRQNKPNWEVPPGGMFLLVLALASFLLGSLQASGSWGMETQAPSPVVKGEESFLQHLISTTLAEESLPHAETASLQPQETSETPPSEVVSSRSSSPTPQIPSAFPAATKMMLLALGTVLSLLGIVAYLLKRYLLRPHLFGKGDKRLRVAARVSLAPKTAIALVEVPGKLLVIGVTGNTLVPLGEAPEIGTDEAASTAKTSSSTFATTLEQRLEASKDQHPAADPLVQVSERIQRKVSRLKRL